MTFMFSILALMLIFLIIFVGLGLPLARSLQHPTPEKLFAAFFIGWGIAVMLLQVWHLLLPINGLAMLVVLVVSLAFWYWSGRPVMKWIWGLPRTLLSVMSLLAFGIMFLLVNQSLYSPSAYDHGLYHLPTVRWLQSYPIVPGLGNLHHRLAFNNASLLVVAMMDSGPQHGLIYYTATTLMFSALALRGLLGAFRIAQGSVSLRNGLYTLLLPVILWYVTRTEHTYAGYTTDGVVFFFQAVLAAELLYFFEQAQQNAPRPQRIVQAWLLTFGVLVGLVVKFSMAVFGLGVMSAVAWGWMLGERPSASDNRAVLQRVAVTSALVLIPWLARHALLSGYLLFPSTLIALPVRWRIPIDLAEPVAIVIRLWARTGGVVAPGQPFFEWLGWWWNHQNFEFKETWVYTAVLLTLVIALKPRAHTRSNGEHGLWALLAITAASLAFWFWMAPAPRFAAALIWLFPLIPALMLIQYASRLAWLRFPNSAYAVALFVILLWLQPAFTNNISRAWLLFPPRESELAARLLHDSPERSRQTNSGLTVYIASDEFEERCFDQQLPCTRLHEFDPRLSLIVPGDLRSGFWMEIQEP